MGRSLLAANFVTVSAFAFLALANVVPSVAAAQDAPAPDTARSRDTVLSVAQVTRDIALAREVYGRVHPGYDRYTPLADIDAAWDDLLDTARDKGGLSLGEFYLGTQRVLAMIRCDHTKAEWPRDVAAARKMMPTYLPFRWTFVEGRAFIIDPVPDSSFRAKDEVLAIDGVTIETLSETWLPLIPTDGYNEHTKPPQLAFSSEFAGGAIEHFGAIKSAPNPEVTVTVRAPGEAPRDVTAPRLTSDEWKAHLARTQKFRRNFKDEVRYSRIDDTTGYLKVATFVNYREPVKPKSVYDPVFKMIKDKNVSTLILDLRSNGGGSSDASSGLFKRLIKKPSRVMKDVQMKTIDFDGIRDYLWTWDKRALKPGALWVRKKNSETSYSLRDLVTGGATKRHKPHKLAFDGTLIILIDETISSGSNHLISALSTREDTIMVGSQGGGSAEGVTAGVLYTLTLPESRLPLRVPGWLQYVDTDSFERGYGVKPDVDAPMTVEAWLAGRDPALDAANSYSATR
ncbi:MAG: S41 family peptidase [Pseudomonadota bacterium]